MSTEELAGCEWISITIGKPYDQFILFGDSIIQRSSCQDRGFAFAPALQDVFFYVRLGGVVESMIRGIITYIRRVDVFNRGFSGYTTQNALHILPRFMPQPSQATVRLMLIFFGANDACLPGHFQHVPIDLYCDSLRRLCHHPSVGAHDAQILLVTPPPVNEYQLVQDPENPLRTAETTKHYADACRNVGCDMDLPIVDLWSAFMSKAGWKEGEPLTGSSEAKSSDILRTLLIDGESLIHLLPSLCVDNKAKGLHFNPEGYRLMFEEVMKVIGEKLPELSPEKLPTIYPPWEQAPKLATIDEERNQSTGCQ